MTTPRTLFWYAGLAGGIWLTTDLCGGAESSPTTVVRSQSSLGTAAQRASATRGGTAKGPLPDPLLLDGSTQTAEKKSEYGMIGDFELPGDENVKNGKVGGQQMPNGAQGGGQNSNSQAGLPQSGGGGGQQSSAQAGGAQGGQPGQQGQQGGGQGGIPTQQNAGQQPAGGGGQSGGPDNPNAAGNPVGGAGDPGGKPDGVQVTELGGVSSNQPGAAGGGIPGGKPMPVGIGDKAMRIDQSNTSKDVVGGQKQIADGHVQQHEKGTGTGGKGPTGVQGPGRVEKGRTIPAGL